MPGHGVFFLVHFDMCALPEKIEFLVNYQMCKNDKLYLVENIN